MVTDLERTRASGKNMKDKKILVMPSEASYGIF